MSRILFVEEAPSVGGSVFSLLQLVTGLDTSRFEPFVLFRYDLPVRRIYREAGIANATWAEVTGSREMTPPDTRSPELPKYKTSDFYRLLWSIKRYLNHHRKEAATIAPWISKESFTLVHTNNALPANLTFLCASSHLGLPAVSHQRGYFRLTALHRHAAKHVERFLCVSKSVSEHYVGQGLPAHKVRTVYNGIAIEKLPSREQRERGNDLLVGWFGRLERWKGAVTLLDAARIVLRERSDVRFIVAGTGPEEAALRSYAGNDPALERHVTFLGFRDDSIDIMGTCDIVVSTSIEPEPLTRSALEAIAVGVPFIASRCGGNPEIIEEGVSGFLYEPGNPEQLAEKLLELLGSEELRNRFAARGRKRAASVFSAERYVSEVESVYSEILGSHST